MSNFHGTHIMVDYTGFFPTINDVETWILSLMERIVDDARHEGFIPTLRLLMVISLHPASLRLYCWTKAT